MAAKVGYQGVMSSRHVPKSENQGGREVMRRADLPKSGGRTPPLPPPLAHACHLVVFTYQDGTEQS